MSGDGVISGPAGNGRLSAILRDDVAAAAAAVLTSDGHDGRDVRPDRARRASAWPRRRSALGARFEDETEEQAYASRALRRPDWEVRAG